LHGKYMAISPSLLLAHLTIKTSPSARHQLAP
jgi:hypothetical protein